jgi:hypothetical protein
MGKISNNLITEKALRATRVNKAIENFIKANGGKFTIMYPDSNPEHIAYTASITSPSDYSRNGNVGVSRKVRKYIPGKGPRIYTNTMFNKEASRYVANALNKATGHDKEMSKEHFKEPSTESTSNSTVKNSVWNKLKNSKAGNWLKNTKAGTKASNWLKNAEAAGNWLRNSKVGGYFTDSPLTPHNVALTYKPHMGGTPILRAIAANPLAYAINAYGMGSGGGYMPVGEHTVDQLRIQHGKDELSNQGTTVPINPQGTQYLDPALGIVDTQVLKDEDGIRYYRNAQTGQFDPLDSGAPFRYSSIPVEQTPFPKFRTFNIGDDIDYSTDSDANKPLPPMSADEGEIPPGTVEVGPDTEKPVDKPIVASVVKPKKVANIPVQPAKPLRRVPKPGVVNDTPVAVIPDVPTPNVVTPTLSSVIPQAVRHNGGFDDYRRQSVLSALRAAGGISPAEAVQRGIIPWEALNYV